METELRDYLDKIFELEGLFLLLLKRDDISKELISLISKKGKEIGEFCSYLSQNTNSICFSDSTKTLDSACEEYSIDDSDFISESSKNISSNKASEIDVPNQKMTGKLVFSLNDRFRFRKELFENSDIDFNNTLALVASMNDYEEAEDFFINEEGFDRFNPTVIEFLEIIKNYFK